MTGNRDFEMRKKILQGKGLCFVPWLRFGGVVDDLAPAGDGDGEVDKLWSFSVPCLSESDDEKLFSFVPRSDDVQSFGV